MKQLIIDINENVYNALTHTEFDAKLVVNEMRKSIVNGVPIPDNATNEIETIIRRYTDEQTN